jgi:hypothetical protein
MSATVREATLEFISDIHKYFLKDLDQLTEEQVQNSPGGAARKPIDYIFECARVHDFIYLRLTGGDVASAWVGVERDENKFIVAPPGLTKDAARQDFSESLMKIHKLIEDSSDEDMLKVVKTSMGEEPFYSLAMFAAVHSNYHNGQLSQVQGLGGDGKNHWF